MPERDRDRQLLLDELEDGDVAEVALAEIERQIVLHHQEEALVRRLVEAELLLEALDELGVEALGAAVFRGHGIGGALAELGPRGLAAHAVAAAAADLLADRALGAGELGDDLLDGAARRELHDREADQHDADHRRHDEECALQEICGHRSVPLPYMPFSLASFAESYHQVSSAPRSYLGFTSGQPSLFQKARLWTPLYHCGTQ